MAGERKVSLSFLAVTLLIAAILTAQGCQIRENSKTREALCTLRDAKQREVENAQDFLKLTVAQRIQKYGPELGHIPDSAIESGIREDQHTVDALDPLDCA